MGFVLLEAGLAGIPVVASRVGGIPEVIEHEKTGMLLKPRNTEEIAATLVMLAQNPEQRKTLGENLKRKVEADFSLDRMVKETVAVYLGSNT
jgi:glycosyltransferase involved in cell wall biosynthesis